MSPPLSQTSPALPAGPSAPNPTSALRNELLSSSPKTNPSKLINSALEDDDDADELPGSDSDAEDDDAMDVDDPKTPNGKKKERIVDPTTGLTPSAMRRAKAADERKRAKKERKDMESDITGAREGMEKQKVSGRNVI